MGVWSRLWHKGDLRRSLTVQAQPRRGAGSVGLRAVTRPSCSLQCRMVRGLHSAHSSETPISDNTLKKCASNLRTGTLRPTPANRVASAPALRVGAGTLHVCGEPLPCRNSGAHGVTRPTFARLVGRAASARRQTYGLGCGCGGAPGFACSPGFGGAVPGGAPPGRSASAGTAIRSGTVNESG